MFSLSITGCDFFADGDLQQNAPGKPQVSSIKFDKNKLELKVGSIEYINIDYKPNDAEFKPEFSYDTSKIEVSPKDNGIVIKALEEGQTQLTVSCNNHSATCIITISGYEIGYEKIIEPYIYSNTNILQLSPGLSEKVFVSLYGGSVADINNYTWSVEDNAVCTIEPTGQYGLIKGVAPGYTRIKVTHSKATYPYYMGVYVFEDPSKATYITTQNNIVTMNLDDSEQSIVVSLVNSLETSLESDFHWEIITDEQSNGNPINLSSNGSKAVISPAKSGQCTIRVTHPDSVYPLDILCRVITIVQNVYIEPDTSILTLSGTKEERITSRLVNLNPGEYSLNDYQYKIDNPEVAEITAAIGETVYLKGKKNGSTKLIISHAKSAYTREVLLLSTNQITDAIDASCYITTTNNYVKTKVGNSPQEINVSLKGGEDGDEKDFSWTVENYAADGSADNVISLETPTGNVFVSRMAAQSYAFGNAYINPVKEGTAIIKVTHPKVLYPLEILVKVLSKDAILEESLYFKGDGLVRVLNGEKYDYTVSLNGKTKTTTDNSAISWEIDDNRLVVNANEDTAEISAPVMGTGCTISHLTVSHPKVEVPKSVLVMTADDIETLMRMKAIFTDKNYYNLQIGESIQLCVSTVGFDSTYNEETNELIPYDFSQLNWTVDRTGIIDISPNPSDKRVINLTALKAGTVKLKALLEGCECVYTITIYPVGAVQLDPEIYFTTTQNVLVFNEVNSSKQVTVTAINMPGNMYSDIIWTCDKTDVCSVVPNGTSATITALAEGEAIISVSHPQSQNTLKIYVKIGSEYVIQETQVVYISSQDVITMLRDEQPQRLQAALVNYTGADSEQFSFTIDNPDIAKISAQTQAGIAYIAPVSSGQAEVTITNPLAQISKKVLIVVGNSAEELAGIKYLTTTNNVVSIGEGKNKTVNVSVKNAEDIVLDGYTWTSSNYSIADVTANGATASIKANSVGTAVITVTNTVCKYPLQIIVHVVDPIAASAHPYIQLNSSVLVLNVDNTFNSISADLIGGSDDDKAMFNWTSKDPAICMCYGQNEVGKIKAVAEGTTYITVSHPKAEYSAQILVICEKKLESECYISVPSSVVNMKPTDESTSITATLINGNANDKYNFSWSLDVYDIIDLQYSANVCTIKPRQAGTATITISHPKADFDQQIIVNVQEYTTFAFPSSNITITQGEVKFLNMQVPTTSVKTHIEYFVKNEKICSVAGTKRVAQITGITSGSTTVTAKLIASNTGAEQASSELMIYVKERAVTDAYITSASTIYTVQKGKSKTLSASITGTDIITSDQANLKWTTSDSDVIEVTGLNTSGFVKGQSIYITAKKAGEAIITCSHEKASSALEFYVVVPGSEKKIVTLNKSYITVVKGSSGASLTANIENAESNDDYNNLQWSCIAGNGVDGNTIARVMGSGKTVQIYPVSPGEVTVMAQLTDSDSVAKCTVIVEAGKSLTVENTGVKIHPFEEKLLKYNVSPNNAIITWTRNSIDDSFEYQDLGYDSSGVGTLKITGIKEGQGLLMGTTDGGATVKLTVKCGWDYFFTIDKTSIKSSPDIPCHIQFSVNPPESNIQVIGGEELFTVEISKDGKKVVGEDGVEKTIYTGTGVITLTAKQEGIVKDVVIRATNPLANNALVASAINISSVTFQYEKGQIRPSYSIISQKNYNTGATAYFSKIDGDSIVLGDGEKITVKETLGKAKVNATITRTITLNPAFASLVSFNDGDDSFTLEHRQDVTEEAYRIKEGYSPTYNGSTKYPDGTPISVSDFVLKADAYDWGTYADNERIWNWQKISTHHDQVKGRFSIYNNKMSQMALLWSSDSKIYREESKEFGERYPNCDSVIEAKDLKLGTNWGRVRDTSLDGKCYSKEIFEQIAWYYFPQETWDATERMHLIHKNGEIFTQNITAEYVDVTTDASVTKLDTIGNINIVIKHAGLEEKMTIPILLETRKCANTQH